jgi:hypothetical protein
VTATVVAERASAGWTIHGLVPPEDPAALARAIVARLCQPDRAAAEGAAGARHAAQHFYCRRTFRALADVSADLVAAGPQGYRARIRSR